jgi:hypothetical protein
MNIILIFLYDKVIRIKSIESVFKSNQVYSIQACRLKSIQSKKIDLLAFNFEIDSALFFTDSAQFGTTEISDNF